MERLADQLEAVNEHAFVHGSTGAALYGGRPCTADWAVAAGGAAPAPRTPAPADDGTGLDAADGGPAAAAPAAEGSAGELGEEVEVAPAGRLPFQEASLQVLSAADPPPGAGAGGSAAEEGVPIEGLDLGALAAYVGVAGASVVKPAVSTPTAAAAGAAAAVLGAAAGSASGSLARMGTGLSEISQLEGLDLAAAAGSGTVGAAAAPAHDETAAQAAARAEFRRDTAGGAEAEGRMPGCCHCRRPTCCCLSLSFIACLCLQPKTADDEDDFFSSDEESAPTDADSRHVPACLRGFHRHAARAFGDGCIAESHASACPLTYPYRLLLPAAAHPRRSVASASITGSQRFRIAIRPAEEAGGGPASARGGDPSALRAAAQVRGSSRASCHVPSAAGLPQLPSVGWPVLIWPSPIPPLLPAEPAPGPGRPEQRRVDARRLGALRRSAAAACRLGGECCACSLCAVVYREAVPS